MGVPLPTGDMFSSKVCFLGSLYSFYVILICSFSQLRASIWSSRLGRRSLRSGSPIHYRLLRHRWRRSLQERWICGAWRPTSYGFVPSSFRPSENCCSSMDAFLKQFKRRINGKFKQFAQKEPEGSVLQLGQQLREEIPVSDLIFFERFTEMSRSCSPDLKHTRNFQ